MSDDSQQPLNDWVVGHVIRGAGRGADLGFPTANLQTSRALDEGIFAVWAQLQNEESVRPAVLHVGPKPVFDEYDPTVEMHILDFKGDIYGQDIAFQVVRKLRDVENFVTVEELTAAMSKDCETAKEILKSA